MPEKRYSIVRVDENCPNKLENLSAPCITSCKRFDCKNCRYGDTKEHLVHKIAQVIFKKRNSFGGKNMNPIWTETDKIYSYKLAKEIIEFLGVEDESR